LRIRAVSVFDRLFKRSSPAVAAPEAVHETASASSSTARGQDEAPIDAHDVRDIVRVEETQDAEFFAGDLFRRRFRQTPPAMPRHFVTFYREGRTRYLPLGYVHYTKFEDSYLCGGLVIDERLYRRLPSAHRRLIRRAGGVAEIMLRETFARLAPAPAIFGYVGDKQAEAVDLRVGFCRTDHRYVMVAWQRKLPDDEKAARLARVIAVGPF
jgi:hypothetical protein